MDKNDCPKTMSGIHKFVKASLYRGLSEALVSPVEAEPDAITYLKCFMCGILDDRGETNG